MKWTAYIGEKAVREGRFDSKREALRAAWFSTEPGSFFFLIGRGTDPMDPWPRRLTIYRRSDCAPLFTTDSWTLGTEVDIAKDLIRE
jgi:hypothetical protein